MIVTPPKTNIAAPASDTPGESAAAANRYATTLLGLAEARGTAATFCPSEAARALGGAHPDGWGPLMQPIRREAVRLALEGRLVIYRKGKPADPLDFKGVYRLGLPRSE